MYFYLNDAGGGVKKGKGPTQSKKVTHGRSADKNRKAMDRNASRGGGSGLKAGGKSPVREKPRLATVWKTGRGEKDEVQKDERRPTVHGGEDKRTEGIMGVNIPKRVLLLDKFRGTRVAARQGVGRRGNWERKELRDAFITGKREEF